MFACRFDEAGGAVFAAFWGHTEVDAEYEEYLAAIEAAVASSWRRTAFLLVYIADGFPPPSAKWRRRIALASAQTSPGAVFALATRSRLNRATITAVNWLRPPTYAFAAKATLREAVAFCVEHGCDVYWPRWWAWFEELVPGEFREH